MHSKSNAMYIAATLMYMEHLEMPFMAFNPVSSPDMLGGCYYRITTCPGLWQLTTLSHDIVAIIDDYIDDHFTSTIVASKRTA